MQHGMQLLAYRIISISFAGLSICKMHQRKEKICYREITVYLKINPKYSIGSISTFLYGFVSVSTYFSLEK